MTIRIRNKQSSLKKEIIKVRKYKMYASNPNFTLPTHMQYFFHLIIDHRFFMQSVFVVITMLENLYCTKLSNKITNSLENALISSWLHTLPCGGPFVFVGGGVLL